MIPPVPVGTIVPFYGESVDKLPAGWLCCDGKTFDQNKYPELEPAIGASAVPDLRGYFLRGLDTSGKVDPDKNRARGSVQQDALQDHYHVYVYAPQSGDGYSGGSKRPINWNADANTTGAQNARTATETRPKNVGVLYCIKAR